MRATTVVLAAVLAAAVAPALARETIVGRWGESRDVCGSGIDRKSVV
jgi:uncharacterized protein (DUF2147 family)